MFVVGQFGHIAGKQKYDAYKHFTAAPSIIAKKEKKELMTEEPKQWFFKDFLGRTCGPFPNEETATKVMGDFNIWLAEQHWKAFHGGIIWPTVRLTC